MIDISAATRANTQRMNSMNAKNGHRPNMFDTILADRSLLLSDDWPPDVDRMIIQYKIAVEDMPRQRAVAAVLDDNPSMDFLLRYRRQQFASLALQYCMLPSDQKDEFANSLVEWWRLVRANEDRAALHLAEHKRRAS
jgi:hypothetical protein